MKKKKKGLRRETDRSGSQSVGPGVFKAAIRTTIAPSASVTKELFSVIVRIKPVQCPEAFSPCLTLPSNPPLFSSHLSFPIRSAIERFILVVVDTTPLLSNDGDCILFVFH